jgi:hypothetical protein
MWYLPSPYAVRVSAVEDGEFEVTWFSRVASLAKDLWVAVGSGVWDASRPRYTDWRPASGPVGWHGWIQRVPVDAVNEGLTAWTGPEAHPWFAIPIAGPPTRLGEQRMRAWQLLQPQQKPIEEVVRLTPSSANKQGASHLEVGLGNALSALGWSVVNVGFPAKHEGVDLVTFHEASGRAAAVSVTVGNDVRRKLDHLLNARQELGQTLNAWEVRWMIATSLSNENLDASAYQTCQSNDVTVLTREDLRLLEHLGRFAARFDSFWMVDPVAELLDGRRRGVFMRR